jgi:hypothetical protein
MDYRILVHKDLLINSLKIKLIDRRLDIIECYEKENYCNLIQFTLSSDAINDTSEFEEHIFLKIDKDGKHNSPLQLYCLFDWL